MVWAPILGVVGLIFAGMIYAYVVKQPVGTDLMRDISDAIHEGAMAFLKREYRVLAVFIVLVVFWHQSGNGIGLFVWGYLFDFGGFYRHASRNACQCQNGFCGQSGGAG